MHFTVHGLLLLLLVLLSLGALLWLTLAVLMAWAMLCPPRMSSGKAIYHLRRLSPGDLGLNFEEQLFLVRQAKRAEKLSIAAWWIPAPAASDRCVIILHGYADAKVGSIAWAPLFHALNCNVLALDLRGHGESGGRFTTGGFFEREDVDQVIDQLLNLYPNQTRELILLGISLGAAVACAVAAQRSDTSAQRSNIAALILDSPFADYRRAITAHTRLVGLPGGRLLQFSIAFAQWLSNAEFNAVRPVDLLKKIQCPVLTLVGSDDVLLDSQDIQALKQATCSNPASTFRLIENAGHIQAMTLDPIEYESNIKSFLDRLPRQQVTSDKTTHE
jgi:pimeloyl-ACP methyl ester carboxylesterase